MDNSSSFLWRNLFPEDNRILLAETAGRLGIIPKSTEANAKFVYLAKKLLVGVGLVMVIKDELEIIVGVYAKQDNAKFHVKASF